VSEDHPDRGRINLWADGDAVQLTCEEIPEPGTGRRISIARSFAKDAYARGIDQLAACGEARIQGVASGEMIMRTRPDRSVEIEVREDPSERSSPLRIPLNRSVLDLRPRPIYNSGCYFTEVAIDEFGFREYDTRWIIEPIRAQDIQLNYRGLVQLGYWTGRFLATREMGSHEKIVVGHDYRKYSENAKNALVVGLMASGLDVVDVGLTMSPGVYFAQYAYDIPACAMLTASHNENGWTGVKIGQGFSRTFEPQQMEAFKAFIRSAGRGFAPSGRVSRYEQKSDCNRRYIDDLVGGWKDRLRGAGALKIAVETGNGTGGLILPPLLRALGCSLVCGHVEADWTFPHFNPNPESVPFMNSVRDLVLREKADLGICLDGDGDRLGIVDDKGRVVFSDIIGLLIARRLEQENGPAAFVVDVKSTSLYLKLLKSKILWEKAGHSYIKARVAREGALAGFERSGHFFFAKPYGRGYDDGGLSALMALWLLCRQREQGRSFSDLVDALPRSFQSPNRQPVVPEARKYEVVQEIQSRLEGILAPTRSFAGMPVRDLMTVNGIRINFSDGSWILVRASSNTPNLVIIAETFETGVEGMKRLDGALRGVLKGIPDLGDFAPLYEMT
jgi:phosphomannomutase/phosphoglucomutase